MKLELLKPAEGSVKNNTRLGRGQGSGGGGTAKRGHKGAKSRSGYSQKRGFEGGQMPLQRRLPKFGFKNINRVEYKAINLDTIQSLVESTGINKIDLSFLKEHGLVSKFDLVKILGRGEMNAPVAIKVHAFSKTAIESIEKAGGNALLVSDETSLESIEIASVSVKGKKAVAAEVSVPELVAEEAPKAKTSKKAKSGDELEKIEGIGPKIADLFRNAGIDTFQKLAETSVDSMKEILSNAGSNFASHDPFTWAEQATLAAAGNWDELKALQDKLNGGRPE
jgi:large subunit ribosomal protein L15